MAEQEFAVGFLVFYIVYLLLVLGVSIAMYLLQAFGIYTMGKNMGFKHPWLSFIPYANVYAFGKVAETYVKPDGRPSAKFSKILLTLEIVLAAIAVLMFVVLVVVLVANAASLDEPTTEAVLSIVIPILLFYLAIIGVAIAYSIVFYIALWRIFALYDFKNATLYLVLSIFISFLSPIFLFILRKKIPKFTLDQRLNLTPIEQSVVQAEE